MTPHNLNTRTLRPGEQSLPSATMVEDQPEGPGGSAGSLAEWRGDRASRDRIAETVAVLESAVTALSAPSLTPADLQAARHTNRQLAEVVERGVADTAAEASTLINAFHERLSLRCANARMVELLGEEMTLLRALDAGAAPLSSARLRRIVEEHEDIVNQIEADPAASTMPYMLRTHRGHTCRL
ncbi:FCD domain-containing protein [Dactylosporangium sp. CA-092794]|uniref:FCD domain-containing protein n=1 Tax=Dactylosporangium sp. CA-092794 TaxID=3239929 RepID=UPI003D8A8405